MTYSITCTLQSLGPYNPEAPEAPEALKLKTFKRCRAQLEEGKTPPKKKDPNAQMSVSWKAEGDCVVSG